MGLRSEVGEFIKKYYEVSEITEAVFKRDYLNCPKFAGMYLETGKKYLPFAVLQYLFMSLVYLFHIYLFLASSLSLMYYNFTLATFQFQLTVLILFAIVAFVHYNMKRSDMNTIHTEMIHKMFEYEADNTEFLEMLYSQMRREKKQLLVGPVFAMLGGGNLIIATPLVDSAYGSYGFNATALEFPPWRLPIPLFSYPVPLHDPKLFYLAAALIGLLTFFTASVIATSGLMFINAAQVFCVHLKYLSFNMETIEPRALRMFYKVTGNSGTTPISQRELCANSMYLRCYRACLRRCIHHHQKLFKYGTSHLF